jgi:hypothetical protein
VLIGFSLETMYVPPGGLNDFLKSRESGWLFFFVIGWLAAIAFLLMLFALLAQIVFRALLRSLVRRREYFILNRYFMAVPKEAVESVSIGRFGRFDSPAIILSLRDGRTKIIPTVSLSEDAEVILARPCR